ncbi:rhamnan synthesis F family protein [Acetobacter nitrogenifigens]|nr:rhamnan synthesis F family protein [Acetobacter nitrogenifigens]
MPPCATSVCLFAAYAPDGILPPHTIYYLSQISKEGFIIHIALAGALRASPDSLTFCEAHGIKIWPRPNAGLDFGSWQYLKRIGCADGATQVLLANDSVFGPMTPLTPIFAKMMHNDAPVWGLVGSRAITRHLQSWFVCFEKKSFEHPVIARFFEQDFASMSREEVIWHGELGLAVACNAAELVFDAAWKDWNSVSSRFFPANPMHTRWRRFAAGRDIPFIKVELIRDDPFNLGVAQKWRSIVQGQYGFDPLWIEAYLMTHAQQLNQHAKNPNMMGKILYKILYVMHL